MNGDFIERLGEMDRCGLWEVLAESRARGNTIAASSFRVVGAACGRFVDDTDLTVGTISVSFAFTILGTRDTDAFGCYWRTGRSLVAGWHIE